MAKLEPVRLGIVGLRYGSTVCEGLAGHPVRLLRVCDLDPEKAQAASARFGVPAAPSLEAMLEDPELEAIGLYTPPAGRAELVRRVIRAGKHVMTTKPFELDAAAAREVLEEAARLGRVVHLNSPNPRPYGEMAPISEWLAAGEIGRPVLAQASTWVSYHEQPDGGWYDDRRRCPLAPIFRIGIYPLNSLLAIFPEPETVQVAWSRVQTARPTPDHASLTISFAGGGIANIVASFAVGGPDRYRNTMTIAGTQGVIYYAIGPRTRDGVPLPNLVLSAEGRSEWRTVTSHAGEYDWEFFARRVRGRAAADVTTPRQVVTGIRVVEAMAQAEETGQPTPVQP